jgi:hypothetical protein
MQTTPSRKGAWPAAVERFPSHIRLAAVGSRVHPVGGGGARGRRWWPGKQEKALDVAAGLGKGGRPRAERPDLRSSVLHRRCLPLVSSSTVGSAASAPRQRLPSPLLRSARPELAGGVVQIAAAQAGGAGGRESSGRRSSAGEEDGRSLSRWRSCWLASCADDGGVEKREREWGGEWVRGGGQQSRWDAVSPRLSDGEGLLHFAATDAAAAGVPTVAEAAAFWGCSMRCTCCWSRSEAVNNVS